MYFEKERRKGIHISVRDKKKGDYSGRISVLYHT